MSYSISPNLDFLLMLSLAVNGFWLGGRFVSWCRTSVARLRWATLAAVGVTLVTGCLYIFSGSGTTGHIIWQTLSRLSTPVMLCYVGEWIRVSPAPWGRGEALHS